MRLSSSPDDLMNNNRSPLPRASMLIILLSQPCPALFLELWYLQEFFNFPWKHADVRITF